MVKSLGTVIDAAGFSAQVHAGLAARTQYRQGATAEDDSLGTRANGILNCAVGILQKELSKNPTSIAQVDNANIDSKVKALGTAIDTAGFSAHDHTIVAALKQSW